MFLLISGDVGAFVQRQTGELLCVYGQGIYGVRKVSIRMLSFSVCSQTLFMSATTIVTVPVMIIAATS